MLFYVFNKAKITKITGLCLGLVLLVGFIPTAQALPLPLSYFTPQQFSTFAGVPSLGHPSSGAVAGIGFTTTTTYTQTGQTIPPKISTLTPGILQKSPDPAFPAGGGVPGLIWGSRGPGQLGTVTFTFDKPFNQACHVFVDDVDSSTNFKFWFFDKDNVLLNPSTYLVNDISNVASNALPVVTKTARFIEFKGRAATTDELTQEIIPNTNAVRKIQAEYSARKNVGGIIGIYFSCSIPHIRKVFTPDTINQGEVSKLEFEIDVFGNPVSGGHFLDNLPSGLMVADPSNAVTDCGGGSTVSVTRDAVNGDHINLHDLNLEYKNYNPASTPDRCTVLVDVTNRPSMSNPDCSSLPPAFTNTATNVATNTFNTDGLTACLVVNLPPDDFGDAPDSYGTILASSGARHTIAGPYIGRAPDGESDGLPGLDATGDDLDNLQDEGGSSSVIFKSFADGPGKFKIEAQVTGTNPISKNAMLCGYLDGAGDGVVNGTFSRDIVYSQFVGHHIAKAGLANEEVCILAYFSTSAPAHEITVTPNTANPGFHGASAKCAIPGSGGGFNCTFTFNPDFTTPVTTYARFRITTDPKFFSLTSPSPIGSALDGEVEGYRLDVNPTAVTIGEVELQAVSAADFIAGLGIGPGDAATLLALLTAWDPEAAAELADAGVEEILAALKQYLDPDADGQVAVLRWDTLEERGTIGFYVERQVGEGDWARINNDMLPGLITAPMGAEYQLADPGARAGTVYNYRLIEQEARGSTRTYGPYTVDMP